MYKRIEGYLQSNYIIVPNEWIPACVEFIKEEHGNSNINNYNWLSEKVYEQWLHADLTDLGTCCLPFNLSNEKCTTIKGQFALQVNHIKDIGLPAYNQLQKLRKDEVDNASVSADKVHTAAWEPKPSRMLLLQLTDGTKVIQGMEYRPIKQLSLSTKPGTKILVKGIIESRKGVLLLTKDHITVLGGEVETLMVPNAPENILRRTLRLEESENPISIPVSFSSNLAAPELQQTQSQYYNTQSTQNSSFSNISSKPKAFVNPTCNLPSTNINQFDDDFEDFMDVETEMALLEAEQKASSTLSAGTQLQPFSQRQSQTFNQSQSQPFSQRQSQTFNQSQSQPFRQINQKPGNSFANEIPSFASTNSQSSSEVSFNNNVNNIKTNFGSSFSTCQSRSSDSFFEDDDDDLLLAAVEVNTNSSSFQRNSITTAKINPFANNWAVKNATFLNPAKIITNTKSTNNLNTRPTQQSGIANSLSTLDSKLQEKTVFSSAKQMVNTKPNLSSNVLGKSGKGNLRQTKLSNFIFEKKVRNENTNVSFQKPDMRSIFELKPPYQYICFMNLHPQEKILYTIKGFVATLLSKLEQNDGKWSLAVKVNDGSGSCDVDIDDQVLKNLMGMSVEEFQLQKQEAVDNPQLRATLGQRVFKCQMELIRMCCLLQLEVTPVTPRPRVTKLIEFTDQHLQLLKERSNRLKPI